MVNTINLQVSVALTTAALGSILVSQVGMYGGMRWAAGWPTLRARGAAGVSEMLMDFTMLIAARWGAKDQ
jgi:hypothetical protein